MDINMNTIVCGDSEKVLQDIPINSVDLIVTDPPYGISFKDWDRDVPSVEIWKQCFHVLKPGAFMFVMSSPRFDVLVEMGKRLKQAGFEIGFSPIFWTYLSGFPHTLNISKAISEKSEGENQQLVGSYAGFSPKPAIELIIVCMKPLSEDSYTKQALNNRRGITFLDDGRIPFENKEVEMIAKSYGNSIRGYKKDFSVTKKEEEHDIVNDYLFSEKGRFPSNLLVEDNILGGEFSGHFSLDIWWNKTIDSIRGLPKSVQQTFPFLIVPKPSISEKDKGLGGFVKKTSNFAPGGELRGERANIHPTLKPLKLFSYLITIASRPNDIVLDPFVGSGTAAISAKMLDRNYIGIDISEEYCKIAEARLKAYKKQKRMGDDL